MGRLLQTRLKTLTREKQPSLFVRNFKYDKKVYNIDTKVFYSRKQNAKQAATKLVCSVNEKELLLKTKGPILLLSIKQKTLKIL